LLCTSNYRREAITRMNKKSAEAIVVPVNKSG